MLKIRLILGLQSLIFLFLTGCMDESYEQKLTNRAERADKNQGEIIIGIAWNHRTPAFLRGIKLAVKKINAEGGVLNRPLKIIINNGETALFEDALSTEEYQDIVMDVAESFVDNTDLVAVIGHLSSRSTQLASVVYQNHGVLFFAPLATNIQVTRHQFDYVFRTILNNAVIGEQVADYVAEKKYKKIALLYDRSVYATELTDAFSTYISKKYGAEIVFRRSFFSDNVNLTPIVIDLKNTSDIDIIFIVSSAKMVQKIYESTRNIGLRLPITGGDSLADPEFLKYIKKWENSKDIKKSLIPSFFNPSIAKNKTFIALYKKEYPEGGKPGQYAALGYDNIMLLAHAIKYTQSTVPAKIANTLRYMLPCNGLAGKYQFTHTGELRHKYFYFMEYSDDGYLFNQVHAAKGLKENIGECNNIDYDEDSVPNSLDNCPRNTPEELKNGVNLIGLSRGCPFDTDNDGVVDNHDSCPKNTEKELEKGVDKQGCPIDTDNDKTPDYIDGCPQSPKFTDGKDCIKDTDNDKVTDDLDKCPENTKAELIKGINKEGCPVDTDLDGVADYLDTCLNNTNEEIILGVNDSGCPVDKDDDKVLDYQDKCLHDPINVNVDNQGCGIIQNSVTLQSLDLLFKQGDTTLTGAGKAYLKSFLTQLAKQEWLEEIKIIVHSDNQGDSEASLILSKEQAIVIRIYFEEHGIDLEKIRVKGKGDTVPIPDEETDESQADSLDNESEKNDRQQKNRRLELIVKEFKNQPHSRIKEQSSEKIKNDESSVASKKK